MHDIMKRLRDIVEKTRLGAKKIVALARRDWGRLVFEMRGTMQWLRNLLPKLGVVGKWIASAIILAGLAVFGAIDFAPLSLPEKWMKHKALALEWLPFVAYLAGVALVIWKWRSFRKWCGKIFAKVHSGKEWAVSDMIWTGLVVMGMIGFGPLLLPDEWIGQDASVLERLQFAAYLVGGGFLILQLRISDRRATALEKGNITERFNNAIEHLTHSSEAIRIGGIHTLYHIAEEASEYKDAVFGILTSHLHDTLNSPKYAMQIRVIRDEDGVEKIDMPTNEVMTILHAFFPALPEGGPMPSLLFGRVNLSELDLRGVLLGGRRMDNVIAEGANLSSASLSYSHLADAHFSYANLAGAYLVQANLEWSFIMGANLKGAVMGGANLTGAALHGSDLTLTNLSRADLGGIMATNAIFNKASCRNADFSEADLEGSAFLETELQGAVITAEQLLVAKTLHGAKLDAHIREEILRRKPELFDPPDETRQ